MAHPHVDQARTADVGPRLVQTITDSFGATAQDQALVAQLVHALGYAPNAVSELRVVTERGRLKIEVTRLASAPGRD